MKTELENLVNGTVLLWVRIPFQVHHYLIGSLRRTVVGRDQTVGDLILQNFRLIGRAQFGRLLTSGPIVILTLEYFLGLYLITRFGTRLRTGCLWNFLLFRYVDKIRRFTTSLNVHYNLFCYDISYRFRISDSEWTCLKIIYYDFYSHWNPQPVTSYWWKFLVKDVNLKKQWFFTTIPVEEVPRRLSLAV